LFAYQTIIILLLVVAVTTMSRVVPLRLLTLRLLQPTAAIPS
jgi:hypothetical protein